MRYCNSENIDAWSFTENESEKEKLVFLLDANKVSINQSLAQGTLLHYVIQNNFSLEWISLLLNRNADPNCQDSFGKTPLHYAHSREIAELLLEKGADIECLDYKKYTPILSAVYNKHYEVFEFLLAKGANPHVINYRQKNIVQTAKKHHDKQYLKKIKDKIKFTNEKMNSIEKFLTIILNEVSEESRMQGKRLLILIGEEHSHYLNYLIQKMLLKIAKDLNIHLVLIEASDEILNSLPPGQDLLIDHLNKKVEAPFKLKGIDNLDLNSLDGTTTEGVLKRNIGMKNEIEDIDQNAIAIVGAAHLYGLLEEKISKINNEHFFIVPFSLLFNHLELFDNHPNVVFLNRQNVIQLKNFQFDLSQARSVIERWNVCKNSVEFCDADPGYESEVDLNNREIFLIDSPLIVGAMFDTLVCSSFNKPSLPIKKRRSHSVIRHVRR